jgi:hypothetical protein
MLVGKNVLGKFGGGGGRGGVEGEAQKMKKS